MFGGHPGTFEFKASLLASNGFASLALAFFGVEGLPSPNFRTLDTYPPSYEKVDLKYFERAIDLLISYRDVKKAAGIGVLCISGSAPIGLMMAVHLQHIRCVVHINGPNYANYGDYVYDNHQYKSIETIPRIYRDKTDPTNDVRSYDVVINDVFKPNPIDCLIQYYNCHHVSFLFFSCRADNCGPVISYTNAIKEQLAAAEHPDYKVVSYPKAGHLLEPPYGIHHRKTWFPLLNAFLDWGGDTSSHCKAQVLAWKEQLTFLNNNLQNHADK